MQVRTQGCIAYTVTVWVIAQGAYLITKPLVIKITNHCPNVLWVRVLALWGVVVA